MWISLGSRSVLLSSSPPGEQLPEGVDPLSRGDIWGDFPTLSGSIWSQTPGACVSFFPSPWLQRCWLAELTDGYPATRRIFGSTSLALALVLDLLGP